MAVTYKEPVEFKVVYLSFNADRLSCDVPSIYLFSRRRDFIQGIFCVNYTSVEVNMRT